MAVKNYSLKQLGQGYKLSTNFSLKEFACKDGSNSVMIDDALITVVQKIRDHFGLPIIINSAFRTPAHNKKVGGSPNSQHLQGKAADIVVRGAQHLAVAQYAESLGIGGIGLYTWGVHIDTRSVITRWDYRSGKQVAVATFGSQVSVPQQAKTVNITVEPKTFMVLGASKQMRSGLIDGENYVHLRDLVAAIGLEVDYDIISRQVRIIK